ncbi:hypothetical protein ACTHGU_10830 [Chitinophagaceae bacterium MMS25-I14]
MTFELPLVEEKIKPHQVTALHVIVGFALCGAGALSYLFELYSKFWTTTVFGSGIVPATILLLLGLAVLYVSFFRNKWLQQPGNTRTFRFAELVLSLSIAIFALLHQRWVPAGVFGLISAAVIFSIFWEKNSRQALVIQVDKQGIRLPVISRKRSIHWPDVNAVLLRYGTLTIDCTDNSLYQWNIRQVNFDREDFEIFCLDLIEEGKTKRDKNDW